MTGSFDKLASSKNNDSKSASKKNNSDNKVNEFDISRNDVEYAKKSGKLSKSRKSKSKIMSKSWNLSKFEKSYQKIGILLI